ncbi:hypothetical protein ACFOYU_10135 [Microvirga sp. GCM10011540]|uniref:hypothetical protein n=1 Tax=Microvirga sp. GCM10011540 TaxID=3317338 RepID=UPI003621E968
MTWIRNKSWLVLTAMLLLAATTISLVDIQAAASDPLLPTHAAHPSSIHLGHAGSGLAAGARHDIASGGAQAAGMIGGLPCNAACPVGSSGCVPAPLTDPADSLLQRDARTVCIGHRDDLMLSGRDPDAQLKPPKSIV